MERKFYTENFEKFLKGHADQFKMTPSKKVWHGIYNDLHPGTRWPSIAMSMVFIFTLVIIGHLNTNNGHTTPIYDINSMSGSNESKTVKKSTITNRTAVKNNTSENNTAVNVPEQDPLNTQLSFLNNFQPSTTPFSATKDLLKSHPGISLADNKNNNPSIEKAENKTVAFITDVPVITDEPVVKQSKIEKLNTKTVENLSITEAEGDRNVSAKTPVKTLPPLANSNDIKKPRRIRTNNIDWTLHIASSISDRYLSNAIINNSVSHKQIIGYESGLTMSMNFIKKLKFTSGIQLNYSGYALRANNTHPIIATLILKSKTIGEEIYNAMSHYGNNTGNEYTTLRNYSLQVSLPIGLQYGFGRNENIKFGVAANIQPSYIISSRAYLLSTDKRNFLTDPELSRKWNFNGSFTPYISIKSSSYNWQLGPQVRYQLFSTYSDRYTVKEHLVNYGLRLGISKISK